MSNLEHLKVLSLVIPYIQVGTNVADQEGVLLNRRKWLTMGWRGKTPNPLAPVRDGERVTVLLYFDRISSVRVKTFEQMIPLWKRLFAGFPHAHYENENAKIVLKSC